MKVLVFAPGLDCRKGAFQSFGQHAVGNDAKQGFFVRCPWPGIGGIPSRDAKDVPAGTDGRLAALELPGNLFVTTGAQQVVLPVCPEAEVGVDVAAGARHAVAYELRCGRA